MDDLNKELLLEVRNDVKQIIGDINDIKVLDAIQNAQLAEHMKRSALNEEQVRLLSAQLEPIKTHVSQVQGGIQAIGIIATVVAVITGLIKLFSMF